MIVIIVIGSVAKTFVHGNEFSEATTRTNRISRRERERERSSRRGPRVASSLFNNLAYRCLFFLMLFYCFYWADRYTPRVIVQCLLSRRVRICRTRYRVNFQVKHVRWIKIGKQFLNRTVYACRYRSSREYYYHNRNERCVATIYRCVDLILLRFNYNLFETRTRNFFSIVKQTGYCLYASEIDRQRKSGNTIDWKKLKIRNDKKKKKRTYYREKNDSVRIESGKWRTTDVNLASLPLYALY